MKKLIGLLFVASLIFCMGSSVHAYPLDYANAGAVVTNGDVTSIATTYPTGRLFSDDQGYGVHGKDTTEINQGEKLFIEFNTDVLANSITVANSGDGDYMRMLIDGLEYDFFPAFGNNLPQTMLSRSTNVGTEQWRLDFTGLNVKGTLFTFLIPANAQASGTTGSDYTILAMDVSAAPEPATMLMLGSGLVGLAGIGRKKFFKRG